MASPSNGAEPLTVRGTLGVASGPVFVRRVTRPAIWHDATRTSDCLYEPDGRVSLWRVGDDQDLRRAAIAINESRESFRERIDFLPILPEELAAAGVDCIQTPGETRCPPAARLHYDAQIGDGNRKRLLETLLAARRQLGRCTSGQMRKAAEASEQDGCFAVVENPTSCNCGEAFQASS